MYFHCYDYVFSQYVYVWLPRKDGAWPALFLVAVLFYLFFCAVLCIIVLFYVLFVLSRSLYCLCVYVY